MRWTKLKQLLEARLAAEAAGRVHVQMTRYRQAHDAEGERILTVDGEKIYGTSYYQREAAREWFDPADPPPHDVAEAVLDAAGFANHTHLAYALFQSLSQPVEDMLASPHPLIRGLAVLDARFGKRRLAAFDPQDEHELVVRLYRLRCPERRVAVTAA